MCDAFGPVIMKKKMANDPKFAKVKLDQVAYGQESAQINQQQALALAEAFPNLKGIIIPAGIGLPAAARALDQAGLLGKIKLTGLAPATLMKKYILAGQAQDIWWNVKDLGYLTYYAAEALATGKITGKKRGNLRGGTPWGAYRRRRRRGYFRPRGYCDARKREFVCFLEISRSGHGEKQLNIE
jgi:ABC-type sugar transport system substrate-binding protein